MKKILLLPLFALPSLALASTSPCEREASPLAAVSTAAAEPAAGFTGPFSSALKGDRRHEHAH